MELAKQLNVFSFENKEFKLWTPVSDSLQKAWENHQFIEFPYWGKCWPAAIALSAFIAKTPSLIQDKIVLELAAGLGLPSLVAAVHAKRVMTSDYLPDPLTYVNKSIAENNITNIETAIINWKDIPENLYADVLLLSDVNYNPDAFDELDKLLAHFLNLGTIIILSTPQRIMAKPFIDKWLPFQVMQEECIVEEDVRVTVFILKKQ